MRSLLRSLFLSLSVLGLAVPLWADTSTPTSTLAIDPSATAGTTITASDENSRNNDVSTYANAHVHALSNTTNFGDGAAGNKQLCADTADSTDACIRWDDTANLWMVDNPTAGSFNQIVTITGTAGLTKAQVVTADGVGAFIATSGGSSGNFLTHQGDGTLPTWTTGISVSNNVTFSRTDAEGSGTETTTGMGFQPTALLVLCVGNSADDLFSIGWGDDDNDEDSIVGQGATQTVLLRTFLTEINDGTNSLSSLLTSLDSDGFTTEWTETNSGLQADCVAMGIR